jgi:hypothetical protein
MGFCARVTHIIDPQGEAMSQLIAGYIDIILKQKKEQGRAEARASAKEVRIAFYTCIIATTGLMYRNLG